MSTNAAPLLEAEQLVKHYELTRGVLVRRRLGAVRAVDDVSLAVHEGETLGLVGETGCGKSTLARMLLQLSEPTSGAIRYRGEDVTHARGARLKALRRERQLVFQDPATSLNPRRTVGAIVAEPFAIHGLLREPGERRRRVRELLERVGLSAEHVNRYPHEFSGGQRQRIGIARAIALEPALLIADEPVSALDVSIQAQILNLLRELQRDLGLTLVLIAHDLSVVRHMCDRVAVMYLGKLVELAPADALYGFPRHPYTGALFSAMPVPVADSATRGERTLLRGEVPSPADPLAGCRFHPRCPKASERCVREEPRLADVGGDVRVACHFPLTRAEATEQLPHGLARSSPPR